MNTVSDLKKRILLLLGDEISSNVGEAIYGGQYSVEALLTGIHAALDAILPWVWKRQVFELSSSSDGYSFTLPADFYQVEGISESLIRTGNVNYFGRYAPMETFRAKETPEPNQVFWLLFPQGKITFSWKIETTAGARMYYAGTWNKPEDDSEMLETPEYAMTALSLYAASICLLGKASAAANIRQYGTKVDNGNPEDNPMLTMSTYFQKAFEIAAQRFPSIPRGVVQ